MIGFVLKIQINLINGSCLLFEGSGAQELGRVNYFGGWPTISISPKQLACASSVNKLIELLVDNVVDDDVIAEEVVKVFSSSRPMESDVVEECYDAYDFISLIKEHITNMSDILSITMESKEYNDFYFYRSYTYNKKSDNYTCEMFGVTDSSCDDQDDEAEFSGVADEFEGYIPTILNFTDAEESKIVQKVRFYRDADEDDIYSAEGCVLTGSEEAGKTCQMEQSVTIGADNLGVVKFGRYPTGNDGETSEIEWLIIDRIDDRVLLISKNIIDFISVHKKSDRVTWETCSLRKWLNSDFIDTVFNNEEQQYITPTTLKADTSMSGILSNICNDTLDSIFILSAKECYQYFTSNSSRAGATTAYADAKRNEKGKANIKRDNLRCSWWIRNDGSAINESGIVFTDGSVYAIGGFKNREIGGLRPAMWVKTEAFSKFGNQIWSNACQIVHAPDCHIINGILTSCHTNVSVLSVPEGVISIGSHAFMNCNHIEDIILSESVTTINDEAFYSCIAKNINIPRNVRSIGKNAFLSCVSLSSIVIPTGITVIEESTFSCCFALEKVVVPNTVTKIASDAFHGCRNVAIYTMAGSYAESFAKANGIPFIIV